MDCLASYTGVTRKCLTWLCTDIRNFIPNELCIRDWIDECKLLDEVHTDNLERKNSDSFFAFLSVLQTLLKESKGSVWEQIKDRWAISVLFKVSVV